jgi:diguanylate cyclase (GGDEF)-like protein
MGGDERERHDRPTEGTARSTLAAVTIAPDSLPPRPSPAGGGADAPASSATTGSLLVLAGLAADVGSHASVDGELRIGRVVGGLVLRDARVSRAHARIWRDGAGWMIEDLGSTNGTNVNGRRIGQPTQLANGDKVLVGDTVLRFAVVDETEAAFFAKMDRLASTDPLTGLPAKHRFDSMLEEELRASRLGDSELSVLMMDLDGLKAINDVHGHAMGANTVAVIGRAIGELLAGRGEACRFGGDEFCAYLPGHSAEDAMAVAHALCERVRATACTLGGVTVHVTISIGVAARADEETAGELVSAADRALYRAKANGRNGAST